LDWVWSDNLTPDETNIVPTLEEKSQEKYEINETSPTSSNSQFKIKQGIAAVSEQVPESTNYLSVLLIALTMSFFSGIVILVLRKFLTYSQNSPE